MTGGRCVGGEVDVPCTPSGSGEEGWDGSLSLSGILTALASVCIQTSYTHCSLFTTPCLSLAPPSRIYHLCRTTRTHTASTHTHVRTHMHVHTQTWMNAPLLLKPKLGH
uniref:Uncharacterized protein n=1 Tax=Gadus morhua TaxID=8049 RepID=A0A8C4ZXP6_GADMO